MPFNLCYQGCSSVRTGFCSRLSSALSLDPGKPQGQGGNEEPTSYLSSIQTLQIPEKKTVCRRKSLTSSEVCVHCSHGFMSAFRHLYTSISSGLNFCDLYLYTMHTSMHTFFLHIYIYREIYIYIYMCVSLYLVSWELYIATPHKKNPQSVNTFLSDLVAMGKSLGVQTDLSLFNSNHLSLPRDLSSSIKATVRRSLAKSRPCTFQPKHCRGQMTSTTCSTDLHRFF